MPCQIAGFNLKCILDSIPQLEPEGNSVKEEIPDELQMIVNHVS